MRTHLSKFLIGLMYMLSLTTDPSDATAQNFPPLTFEVIDSSATKGYYFMSPYTSYASPLYERPHLILDQFGRIVYYQIFPSGSNPIPTIDFKLQPDGRMSYYDITKMKFYLMDSTFMIVDSIQMTHGYETDQHDLQILPDNHYLLFGIENRIMNLTAYHYFGFNHNQPGSASAIVAGVVIQEFDETKALVWEWKGHDHYQFDDVEPIWLSNPNKVDWTHANAVERDIDGNILISLRHFSEITKIDFQTGNILWRLGGKRNQFNFLNDPVRFTGQHDIRRRSDTSVSLFDNGQYSSPSRCRGVEYALDEENKTATLVWEYIYDSAMHSVACGNHHYAENGNHLIDFGFTNDFSKPFMVVVTPGKEKVVEVSMPNGYISYRAFNYVNLPWQLHRPAVECRKIGDQYYLEAEAGHPEYRWNTGETSASVLISDTGEYWVFVPYGMGFISSEHIRITDPVNPCLFTSSENKNQPEEIVLRCYPDPEANRLNIAFTLPQPAQISSAIINMPGLAMETPLSGFFSAGTHEFALDISTLKPGMYILKMVVNGRQVVKKVIL